MSSSDAPLILASGSPQRRQLLDEAGYRFRIVEPRSTAECGVCSKETPGELVARLAYQKAADVVDQLSNMDPPAETRVVACDTVAEVLGRILGKPTNREHAREMLEMLRGREHRVYSGLCLWRLGTGVSRLRVARTTLFMEPLDDARIESYLDSNLWEGKAGAFGWQDRVGWLRIVEGSESNVVGLPLELLAEMLSESGI